MTTYRLELYYPQSGGALPRYEVAVYDAPADVDRLVRIVCHADALPGTFALLIELSLNEDPGVCLASDGPADSVRATRDGERVPVLREHVAARYRVEGGRVLVSRYPVARTLAEREEELR